MTQPLITIGMTCYNSQDTIGDAIQSALAQDWPNTEILIVDDGSKDGSVEAIRTAIADIPHVRLIVHEKNTGFAGALNTLIAQAMGEFLAIFDDDDISHPARLSKQHARIDAYEKETGERLTVCHTARTQRYPDGSTAYEQTAGCVTPPAPHGRNVADRILTGRLSRGVIGSCANCSRMARTETFRAVNGFDQNLRRCEDTDFNIRLALAGGHFLGIEEPLVIQTMTGGKDKTIDAEYTAEKAMYEKHAAYLQSIGWKDFCAAWTEARYAYLRGERGALITRIAMIGLRYPMKTILKIIWSLPASKTRARAQAWYQAEKV